LFLGAHSVRIVAEPWRQAQIARLGENRWKGLYSLVSALGLGLLVWGYAQARLDAAPLFFWPHGLATGLRHLVALLVLLAFWLLAAAYVPRNHLQAAVKHPMVLAVKVWALAHLLVNHTPADLLLFGGFLVWAVLDFRAARRRPVSVPAGRALGTVLTLLIGTVAYGAMAMWAHQAWLGVSPLRAAA
jgi:uncharacterized membrane protein